MAQAKVSASAFGKAAVELGNAAHKAWRPEVWQPLGIKDRTAQQRASADGKGGTRAAMLQVASYGFSDIGLATQAAAYVRATFYGNTSVNTAGISFPWLAQASNLATIASNAQFRADAKGNWKLAIKARQVAKASKAPATPKAPRPASDSRNGEVTIVRQSDKALAEQASNGEAGA